MYKKDDNGCTKVRTAAKVHDVYTDGHYVQILDEHHNLWIKGNHYLPETFVQSDKFIKIAQNVRYMTDSFYITDSGELYVFGW